MPLKIQGQRFAKRNSLFAAVFLTLILSIITGCSSAFNGQKTDVSFCIDSNTAKEILSMAGISEAPEASGARSVVKEEDLQSSKITVWLKGDVEQTKTKDFSEKGVSISFDKIPVGASVWAEAEIYYTDSSAQKVVFCEGKSEEPIVIKAGNTNSLNLKFKVEIKKYNQIIKTDTTYTVLNPILTYQWAKEDLEIEELRTNEVFFNYEKGYEACMWQPSEAGIKVEDYQTVKITFKGTKLKTNEANKIVFAAVRGVSRDYFKNEAEVKAESSTFEFDIPQGKGSLAIGLNNKWDWESGKNDWADDFAFEVEKIELIKNQAKAINYENPVDVNPELISIANATVYYDEKDPGANIVFTSREGKESGESGWAGVYYEFEKLSEYDKIVITFQGTALDKKDNFLGINFDIKGYIPWYKSVELGYADEDRHFDYARYIDFDNDEETDEVRVAISVAELGTSPFTDENGQVTEIPPTAIEIQNMSYTGDWTENGDDQVTWGDDWKLLIKKIEFIKMPEVEKDITIFDPNQGAASSAVIEGTQTQELVTYLNGKKYLKLQPNGWDLSITLPQVFDLQGYMYAKAEVYTDEDDEAMQVGVVLRLRNEESQNWSDPKQRTVDFTSKGSSTDITTLTGVVSSEEKVNHISVFVADSGNGWNPCTDKTVYLGRIIATTCTDLEYDPFKTIKITLPQNDTANDINVTLTDNNGVIVLTADSDYETYTWKVNGTVQTETTNVFTFDTNGKPKGIYDITLFADDPQNGRYHSNPNPIQVNIQ